MQQINTAENEPFRKFITALERAKLPIRVNRKELALIVLRIVAEWMDGNEYEAEKAAKIRNAVGVLNKLNRAMQTAKKALESLGSAEELEALRHEIGDGKDPGESVARYFHPLAHLHTKIALAERQFKEWEEWHRPGRGKPKDRSATLAAALRYILRHAKLTDEHIDGVFIALSGIVPNLTVDAAIKREQRKRTSRPTSTAGT